MRLCVVSLLLSTVSLVVHGAPKQSSALYPPDVVAQVRANTAEGQWAAGVRAKVVAAAAPWRAMDNESLWGLMFGATLPRAWMVWSDGHSPVTGEPVPMYNWKMDAINHPWKVQDPTSGEWFPKNDFKAYYESGLDAHGVFDAATADRSLLFNTEHPDPDDPLHKFGVDDGHGYVNEDGERWRFIAAYLIYGQWKQAVLDGIGNLSAAYVVTGDPVYARKAGILLDRVADLYPTFDFKPQGIMYEGPGTAGYVSTWHDACEETREMALAYDMIFPVIQRDETLVAFLAGQAKTYKLDNAKTTFADIQRNIETGILRDALAHPEKIHSNYPRAEICQAVITRVLQEPDEALWKILDPMLEKATAVDGVTGEKGLANYSAFTIQALAQFLAEFSKADPAFLPAVLARQPRIHDTYRFHIDTQCLDQFYPLTGDTGGYAKPIDRYVGMNFIKPGGGGWPLTPSTYRLLWDLYQATDDVAFAQTLYRENGGTVVGLPHDIYGGGADAMQQQLAAVIEAHGEAIEQSSINKESWRLAVLRSGADTHRRALWLDYDAGGAHGHQDGLNLGLFAHGTDMLPEMGYPAVQFGGWGSPKGRWYRKTAAHNTVVVDQQDQPNGAGETTLWIDEPPVQAIRASAPVLNNGQRYERTAMLVDVDDELFCVIDVFRVAGGHEHTKFIQSYFGRLRFSGLAMGAAPNFGGDHQTRNFALDPAPEAGWEGRWVFDGHYGRLSLAKPVGLAYIDFTNDAAAGRSEAWVNIGGYETSEEHWLPRIVVQRKSAEAPLGQSTFVGLYEPFRGLGPRLTAERLPVSLDGEATEGDDSHVALRIAYPDGGHALVLLRDPTRSGMCTVVDPAGSRLESDGDVAFLQFAPRGWVRYGLLAGGTRLESGPFTLENPNGLPFVTKEQ